MLYNTVRIEITIRLQITYQKLQLFEEKIKGTGLIRAFKTRTQASVIGLCLAWYTSDRGSSKNLINECLKRELGRE